MAIRGKIKVVRIDSYPMTFVAPDGTPITIMLNKAVGTVTDTAAKKDYSFEQPYGNELGLAVNSIVQFDVVALSDGSSVGCSLDPVDKGTVESIDLTTGMGTLKDRAGNIIDFIQNYTTELGINVGSTVRFTSVFADGMIRATCLRLAGN
ncbi:MAG TPA: hypothetical protein PLU73_09565 [Bacteroidia bacterium]|jgi:hypothetical protein|nr:hypothetical protein [Bacteroidia bacterium]